MFLFHLLALGDQSFRALSFPLRSRNTTFKRKAYKCRARSNISVSVGGNELDEYPIDCLNLGE